MMIQRTVALLALTLIGCSTPSLVEPGAAGSVTVALQTAGASGALYQLCNATIDFTGPEVQTIPANVCPDGTPSITLTTAAGTYSVLLSGNWRIEHSINGLPFTPIPATLVSPNPSSVAVVANQTSALNLTFNVNEGDINFGTGSIDVVIVVNELDAGV